MILKTVFNAMVSQLDSNAVKPFERSKKLFSKMFLMAICYLFLKLFNRYPLVYVFSNHVTFTPSLLQVTQNSMAALPHSFITLPLFQEVHYCVPEALVKSFQGG